MPRLIICKKCNYPIAGGLCLCTVGRRTPDMPNIPPPPPKRTQGTCGTCGNCGEKCIKAGLRDWPRCRSWIKRATELEQAHDEFRRAYERLDKAIRAQAQKGHTEP